MGSRKLFLMRKYSKFYNTDVNLHGIPKMLPQLTATDATWPVFFNSEMYKVMKEILTHMTDDGVSDTDPRTYS